MTWRLEARFRPSSHGIEAARNAGAAPEPTDKDRKDVDHARAMSDHGGGAHDRDGDRNRRAEVGPARGSVAEHQNAGVIVALGSAA